MLDPGRFGQVAWSLLTATPSITDLQMWGEALDAEDVMAQTTCGPVPYQTAAPGAEPLNHVWFWTFYRPKNQHSLKHGLHGQVNKTLSMRSSVIMVMVREVECMAMSASELRDPLIVTHIPQAVQTVPQKAHITMSNCHDPTQSAAKIPQLLISRESQFLLRRTFPVGL